MLQRAITLQDLAKANGDQGSPLWVAIRGQVYDLSKFKQLHPGGEAILMRYAGQDATKKFELFHNDTVLPKYQGKLPIVGELTGALADESKAAKAREERRRLLLDPKAFGDQVPYGDPFWYQRSSVSPYYKPTHFEFRARVRAFVDKHVIATMQTWKHDKMPPRELFLNMGKEGFLAAMIGIPFPEDYVDPGTPIPEDFDYFHILILIDEFARCGDVSVCSALTNGCSIACSPIYKFGSEELKRRVLPDVLMGRKFMALGVSEPEAGSDVSGVTTEIRPHPSSPDAVMVYGTKKYITNGMYADFITLLAKDHNGMSMIVVPTDAPGFERRKINVMGSDIGGTALLDLVNVPVPVKNIVGPRGKGWALQMNAFNHERFYVVVEMVRESRVCLEECIKYALKRETFGKHLHQHQSVRMRIARMIRNVESVHAWLEALTFQLSVLPLEKSASLGDMLGLIKVHASYVAEECARDALHVFGGHGIQANGVGYKIEPASGAAKGFLIPAGAADILDDFGARQAFKLATAVAKL